MRDSLHEQLDFWFLLKHWRTKSTQSPYDSIWQRLISQGSSETCVDFPQSPPAPVVS